MRKEPVLAAFSLCLYLFGHLTLAARCEPGLSFFYVTSWWSYIIFLDSAISWRSGRSLFLNRSLPAVVLISCGFWCFFELVNLRLENWFYINVPNKVFLRYSGYLLAYGTVIPAIVLTASAVQPLFADLKARSFTIDGYSSRAILLGITLFVLTMILPEYLFSLAWIFAIPLIDGINYRAGFRSYMADLEQGDMSRLPAALLSGLICGIVWEVWNSLSPVRWVYTVPFLEHMKIFEMPLPGYIGFPVFGVETVAFADLFQGLRQKKIPRRCTVLAAILLSFLSFALIDRYTVFSRTTAVEHLSFLTQRSRDILAASGTRTNLAVDPRLLSGPERAAMAFVNFKGLGYENYLRLTRHGVTRVQDLGMLDEVELSHILGEENLRRVRIYRTAAKAY